MTNFDLTEEQQAVRDMVRRYAREKIAPIAAELDEAQQFPEQSFKKLGEMGILGIGFPEEEGGMGGDTLSYIIAVEELSRVDGSHGITLAAHCSLGVWPIYAFGTTEQKQKYMPKVCSGEYLSSFGLTEPEAGSDAGGTRTTAMLDGDHWVINGSKQFITNATYAGVLVITAKTDKEAKGSHGISAFLVETDLPGFNLGKKENKLGLRASDTRELIFEDCRVPRDALLGELHRGFPLFMKTLDGGRISIAALALGIAQGALDASVPYAMERKQFGQPICEFQMIQSYLADMQTEVTAARHLTYHAARLKDAGKRHSMESAMAKYYASTVAMKATTLAIQIHGGYGYTKDYPVERYFRDAKLCEIGEGTSEVQKIVIARELIKQHAG
ncbi:MAG: acyl-CoA dehydrogenase [Candidatus Eisenbacteria bacterium]|nr:acyl-CoA dehydrogenase [Candidatus Eisenbacteria bacterium]